MKYKQRATGREREDSVYLSKILTIRQIEIEKNWERKREGQRRKRVPERYNVWVLAVSEEDRDLLLTVPLRLVNDLYRVLNLSKPAIIRDYCPLREQEQIAKILSFDTECAQFRNPKSRIIFFSGSPLMKLLSISWSY